MILMNKQMKRLLSLILALVFCMALAVQVSAEDEQVEAATVEEVVEPAVTLTAEMMAEAWNTLLQKMTPEQTGTYGTMVATLNTANYIRQDVLDAVNVCVEYLDTHAQVQAKMAALKDSLAACAGLEDAQKERLAEQLDSGLEAIAFQPVEHLMSAAGNLTLDSTATLTTTEMETYLVKLVDWLVQLDNLEDLLEEAELLAKIDDSLALFTGVMAADQEDIGNQQDNLMLEIREFESRREELAKAVDDFFTLSTEEQVNLAKDIRELAGELETYPTQVLVDAVKYSDALDAELNQTADALEQLESKLVISYIAIGLAGLAVLMIVFVAIFAVGKARGDKVDLSVMASREDVKAVSSQNQILRGQMDQMGLRMEAMTREIETLKARPVVVPAVETKKEEPRVEPPVVVAPPKVEKISLGSSQQIGSLKLHYQSVNPGNSYMTETADGKLTLFEDSTLELVPGQMRMANDLYGWLNNGTFYLFAPEVDGKVLDCSNDKLPAGYYDISEIVRRAKVKSGGTGFYVLQEKGIIRMRKL